MQLRQNRIFSELCVNVQEKKNQIRVVVYRQPNTWNRPPLRVLCRIWPLSSMHILHVSVAVI